MLVRDILAQQAIKIFRQLLHPDEHKRYRWRRAISRDRAYRAGPSPNWVKMKNPKHPAMHRVKESFS
jgi:hypothetical protein